MKVIVVGDGFAALTCAKVLSERDAEVVFEASDGVGGRVPTEEKKGLLLDRGFQMYFTTYPVGRRYLNHEAANLKPFDPGAIVRWGREERHKRVPENFTGSSGLVLARKCIKNSSINGSMLSEEKAAEVRHS